MFFCITRTLSNSLETVLASVSLFYWLSHKGSSRGVQAGSRKMALSVAALACIVRPTSAITWLYLGILEFIQAYDRFKFLFLEVVPIGILVIILSCWLDWWMYGSWVFAPLNFLKFNLLSSGGDYYGTHKWHWYFSQGFPAMLFTFLPFSLIGIFHSKEWRLSGLIAWVLGVYSILGHKEFRFVLSMLPFALMFSGYFLANVSGDQSHDHKQKRLSFFCIRCPSRKYLVLFLIATNVPMALYMSLVHQVSDSS
uniref:Mannosyltransferase n=1 Tax=Anthurium amnicola TaxID=1678845 RepID=A0A1D1ZD38_9ARAE